MTQRKTTTCASIINNFLIFSKRQGKVVTATSESREMRSNNGSGWVTTKLEVTNSFLNKKEYKGGGKKKRGKKKKKKRARGKKMSYHEYMKSSAWKKRKNRYFSKHGKACAVCGKKWGTTLHHTFYDNKSFGSEPDDHFTPLCGQHHKEYHEIHGTQKDMRESTKKYVIHARQMYIFEEESSWIKSL